MKVYFFTRKIKGITKWFWELRHEKHIMARARKEGFSSLYTAVRSWGSTYRYLDWNIADQINELTGEEI